MTAVISTLRGMQWLHWQRTERRWPHWKWIAAIYALSIMTGAQAATLTLINSSPANNAVDISRTDNLSLTFSTAVAAWSANRDTVTLQSAAGAQKVSLTISGAVISIHPLTTLLPWTDYTLNVTSLTGSNGDKLAAPVTLAFRTRDATWQASQSLYNLTTEKLTPVTRINAKGIRFIVWQQINEAGTGRDIWAIRQAPGAPISSPALVGRSPNHPISQLNIFIDENGNAMASWIVEISPVTYPPPWHIWVNRFVAGSGSGSGWGTPQILKPVPMEDPFNNSGTDLHLAFDHAGNALALWKQTICCQLHSLQQIVVSRYTRERGWSVATMLDNSYAFLYGRMDLQFDDSGAAYAAWSMDSDFHYPAPRRMVARFVPATGWTTPLLVSQVPNTIFGEQALAVSPQGEAMLMWLDDQGLKYARADQTGNWSTPISIDPTATSSPSSMALLNNGQGFSALVNGVKQFIPAKNLWTWTHPLLTNQNASTDPRLVADSIGNAVVAWTQTVNGATRIYAKRYRAKYGWLHAQFIDAGTADGAELQDLFLEPDGDATATWLQYNTDGTVAVQAARFE